MVNIIIGFVVGIIIAKIGVSSVLAYIRSQIQNLKK